MHRTNCLKAIEEPLQAAKDGDLVEHASILMG